MRSASSFVHAAVLAAVFWAPSSQKTDLRMEVAEVVRAAVRLLESERHADFLKTYLRPSELERVLATRTLNQAAEEFKAKRAAHLLLALRAAAKKEPALNEDGSRANYDFEAPVGGERRISMVKIEGRWYFR